MIKLNNLQEKLSICCEMDSFSISICSESEKQSLKDFLPKCKSVIVLAHHIKQSIEWTHLRIIITDVEIVDNLPPCENVCKHCGICKAACPAKVIKDDTLLGIECSKYQEKMDSDVGIQESYIFKCEECVRACPIGNIPRRRH